MSDSANVVELNENNFRAEVVESDKPVLVDFWAAWCGPCRMVAPVIDELADEKADVLKVGKVDIDANQMLAQMFQVMSIPTLLVFKDGKVAGTITGARPKSQILAEVEKHL